MLYKDYFIPDSSQYLFFKLLLYKARYPLALGPSTMQQKLPYLLAPSSGLPSCLVIQAICPLAEGASLHPLSTLFPQTPQLAC